MLVVEELKVNKTVQTNIPRPADLYKRFGKMVTDGVNMSGDTEVKINPTKIESAQMAEEALEK